MYKILKKLLLVLITILFSQQVLAQDLHGTVMDKAEGIPLNGVSIKIAGMNKGSISNEKGEFIFTNLAIGNIHLIVSHTGYEMVDTTIQFTGKKWLFSNSAIDKS